MTSSTRAAPDPRTVTPYVPRLLIQRLADRAAVAVEEVEGSVCFVDVSGFTKLSERLAKQGRVGAEELTEAIDSCFTGMLALAYANGGSLLKFGGDALLLFFTGRDHEARACRAAIWMRRTLRDIGKLETSGGKVNLRMSVGVHSGRFAFFLVGGSHREFTIAGPAASHAVLMEHTADAGEIVVSHATAAALSQSVLGAEKGPGRLLKRVPTGRIAEPEEFAAEADPEALLACIPVAIREHILAGVHDPEHRQATVAFLRFEGLEELLLRDGPDVAAAALEELLRDVQTAVDERELCFLGTDVDEGGGKIILTGGVPRSSGNDEERMLLALRAIASGSRTLALRIGVHRGAVFAGDIGPAYRRTYTVMGDTVNLAARLMARAEPGQVLASPDVLEHSTTMFETDELEPFYVKGKAKPVRAFAVGEAAGTHLPVESMHTPFVGRRSELAVLRDSFACARARQGRMVEVIGEAGIGKSRLMDEIAAEAQDFIELTATCELYRRTTAYAPFRALLERLLGVSSNAEAGDSLTRLYQLVAANAPQLVAWIPLLAVPLDIEVPATPETAALDDRFRRDRLEAVMGELLDVLLPAPTLIVIEDAQWIDEASSDLLRSLGSSLEGRPWFVAVMRRPDGDGEAESKEEQQQSLVRLHPTPLDLEDTIALLEAATEDDPLPAHEVRVLAERSGGNPMLARELLAAVRAAGSMEGLPTTVEALVNSRIDRLAPADRALLRRASVLGLSFSPGLLADLLDEDPLPSSDEDWRRLDEFLEVRSDGSLAFRRALVRDAAYEALPYRRRRELHARAGETIERTSPVPEEQAELLSLHFFNARQFEAAWRYARIAGDRARGKSAPIQAAEFYGRALEAARGLPDVATDDLASVWSTLADAQDRAGLFAEAARSVKAALRLVRGDAVREGEYLLKQGWIAERAGRYPQAIRAVNQGIRTLESIDSQVAAKRRSQLLVCQGAIRQDQGRYADAAAWCERAIDEAERSGDRDALAHALFILDWAYVELGRLDEAHHSTRALEIYEDLGDVVGQAAVYNNLGAFAYWRGRWDDAVDLYERGRDARERIGDPVVAAFGTLNIGEIQSDQGRYEEATTAFRRALQVWRAADTPQGVAFATSFLGRLESRSGRYEEAMRLLREAARLFTDVGAAADALEVDALIAECLVFEGRSKEALELADTALLIDAQMGGQGRQAPLLHRVRGYATFQVGDFDNAREAFDESLRAARARGADYEAALTLLGIAELPDANGRDPDPSLSEGMDTLRRLGVRALPKIAGTSAQPIVSES
ncbi:MAG: tetratricopeptide repeat protein [Actinomycetota bacterium]